MRRFLVMAGAAVAGTAIGVTLSRGASGKGWRERLMLTSVGLPSGPLGWVATREMALEHRAMYATMARELDLRPDDDVLDVGCGSGAFLQRHASHVRHVAGVDLSGIPVGMARRRLAERIAGGTAQIVRGDAMALPWPDDRFSVVTAYALPEYVRDPLKALSEMHRVLRPGGRALLTLGFPLQDASLSGTRSAWGLWRWSEADARRLMEEAGFGEVSVSPPPTAWFSLQLASGTKPAAPAVTEIPETQVLVGTPAK